MVRLLIKKSIYDSLENMMKLVLSNIGFLMFLLAMYLILRITGLHPVLAYGLSFLDLFGFSLFLLGFSGMSHGMSSYKKSSVSVFGKTVRRHFISALFFAVCMFIVFLSVSDIIPLYLSIGTSFSYFLALVVLWISVTLCLALQYFYPLTMYVPNVKGPMAPLYTLRKCFLLLGDNILLSVFLALYSILKLALSVLLGFIIPGMASVSILQMNALRFLKLRYDRIEQGLCSDWEEVLSEERSLVGHRSLLDLVRPWKSGH